MEGCLIPLLAEQFRREQAPSAIFKLPSGKRLPDAMVRRLPQRPFNAMTTNHPATTPHSLSVVFCAIYARYSSDKQRQASIQDQIRNCRAEAAKRGWVVLEEHLYIDEDRTGKPA